jgi:hypothetical protein
MGVETGKSKQGQVHNFMEHIDFLNVSKKEFLFPEFDLMVSNEKEGVTELVA